MELPTHICAAQSRAGTLSSEAYHPRYTIFPATNRETRAGTSAVWQDQAIRTDVIPLIPLLHRLFVSPVQLVGTRLRTEIGWHDSCHKDCRVVGIETAVEMIGHDVDNSAR